MKRYCLALDLVNDPLLIDQYKAHHQKVWPEIIKSIKDSGILDMQIYHLADRLFMIIEVKEGFSFCLLYTSPSPRDLSTSRMPSSA